MRRDTENIEEILDLSPLQQGMLFHDALDTTGRTYVGVVRFRVEGFVDERRFAEAWTALCFRHQALRTSFHLRDDGTAIQIVWKDTANTPAFRDLCELAAWEVDEVCTEHVEREKARGFVLAEAPLIRVALFRVEDHVHELIVANHHIIIDGWSLNIVLSELFGRAPSRARPYSKFLNWLSQRDQRAGERFWKSKVGHISAPTPLGIHKRSAPAHRTDDPRRVERILPGPFCSRLRQLARQHGLTLNTVFTGAWALVSSRYSGEDEVVLGVTTSGRSGDLPCADEIVGLLINTVPVPIACPPEAIWSAWSSTLQTELSEIREYEATPLVQIAKLSGVSGGSPLFDSIFVFQNYPGLETPGYNLRMVSSHERVSYPLAITIETDGEKIALSAEFSSDTFESSAIERLLSHIEQMLISIAEHPYGRLGTLDILSSDEKWQLEAWGHPGLSYERAAFVSSLIRARAQSTPDAMAVVCGTLTLSYASSRADQDGSDATSPSEESA